MSDFGLKIGIEGEKAFKQSINQINQSMKVLGSEMKLVESEFDKEDTSMEAVRARSTVLRKEIDAQQNKIGVLTDALKNATTSFGENDKRTQKWATELNLAKAELNKMKKALDENNKTLEESEKQTDETSDAVSDMGDEIDDASDDAKNSKKSFEALGSVCKGVAVAITAAFAAVSAAAVSAGKALVNMSKEGASYADNVLTESTVTGIATDKLQEYMYAAELVDVSVDTLTGSMKKNINSMKQAADGSATYAEAYDELGIAVVDADGNLRNSEDVYWEIIDALGKVENETERNALAMTIMGKSATDLNPLIEAGSEKMEELGKKAQEAGYILSSDTLNAYGALDDQLQYLNSGITAAKNALGTIMMPMLTELASDGVTLLGEFTNGVKNANGDISKMTDAIKDVFPKIVDVIMKYVPMVVELGSTLITSLADALASNLDTIVDSAILIIKTLFDALIKTLPTILNAAMKLGAALINGLLKSLPDIAKVAVKTIVTLAKGISKSLPNLIPAVVEIITEVVTILIQNIPLLISAALELIKGLAKGLLNAIPVLVDALPTIINSIITVILESIPLIIEAGVELLTALVADLPTIIDAIIAALPLIITGIITALLESIPQIIEAGFTLITALINDLPNIILTIVNAIPQIIASVINSLISNIDKFIEAGITIFTALISNLPAIIQGIVSNIPQIISAILNAFSSLPSQMAEIGKNLVKGLWNGIQSLKNWITDSVKGFCSNIWGGIKNFFGIHSPSRKMAWAGEMLVEGLSGGIDDDSKTAYKSARKLSEGISDIVDSITSDESINLKTNVDTKGTMANLRSTLDGISNDIKATQFDVNYGVKGLDNNAESTIYVSVPVYLDGEEISASTSKVQSQKTGSLKRALGVL